jgi:hypothetical protein
MKLYSSLFVMLLWWLALMLIGVVAYHIGDSHSLSLSFNDIPAETRPRLLLLTLFLGLMLTLMQTKLSKQAQR